MTKFLLLISLIFGTFTWANAQREGANWVFGINAGIQFSNQGIPIPFKSKSVTWGSSASYSDSAGNLLFYLHQPGSYVPQQAALPPLKLKNKFDKDLKVVVNGQFIQDTFIFNCSQGYRNSIFLNYENKLHFFTIAGDGKISGIPAYSDYNGVCEPKHLKLFHHSIDVYANNDSGAITKINKEIYPASMFRSLCAIKQANGKSWWLITHSVEKDTFYVFSCDSVIRLIHKFNILPTINLNSLNASPYFGTLTSSSDGKFLSFNTFANTASIYNFDRCNGLISNPFDLRTHSPQQDTFFSSAIFSKNSRYCYLSNGKSIIKIDLLLNNAITLYRYGNFGDCNFFTFLELGLDGNIYLSRSNVSPWGGEDCPDNHFMSVILRPDSSDTTGQFRYKGFYLGDSSWVNSGLPNMPNYQLGPLPTPCNFTPVELTRLPTYRSFTVYPNPASTTITLKAKAGNLNGQLSFYNLSGQVVYQANLSSESTHEWNVSGLPSGIYYLRLADGTNEPFVQKVVVSR